MKKMLGTQPFHGTRFDGSTYDTGSKLGFLAANVAFAMSRPELAEGFREELKQDRRHALSRAGAASGCGPPFNRDAIATI